MIDRCLELGLRKPEFRQDEDFMVTLWRREGVASGNGDVNGVVNSLRGALNEIYLIVLGNPGIKIGQVAHLRPAISTQMQVLELQQQFVGMQWEKPED